jgi:hypothetical protein
MKRRQYSSCDSDGETIGMLVDMRANVSLRNNMVKFVSYVLVLKRDEVFSASFLAVSLPKSQEVFSHFPASRLSYVLIAVYLSFYSIYSSCSIYIA